MKLRRMPIYLVLFAAVLLLAGCTTEPLQIDPNGDARIRTLAVKDANVIPDFDPLVYNYTVLVKDRSQFQVKVIPFIHFTEFRMNGDIVKMNTNMFALPDFTPFDVTRTNMLYIHTSAQDGLQKTYTLTLLDQGSYDAGISALTCNVGSVSPIYSEGIAPNYTVIDSGKTNFYKVTVTNTSYTLQFTKQQAAAKLSVNSTEYGAGALAASAALVHPGDSSVVTNTVTCVSSNGAFTNTKTVAVNYVNPSSDARLLDMKIYNAADGAAITYLPRFDVEQTSYSLVLDNIENIRIVPTAAQAGATVTVKKISVGTDGLYSAETNVTDLNNIRCNMMDKLQIQVVQGSTTNTYTWLVTMFTSQYTYDFRGGIGDYLRFIHDKKEYGQQDHMEVTGIVSFNVAADDGFFIEDAEYGIYVWAGWYGKPDNLMPGQKVRVQFRYGKLWMGFAEIAYSAAWNSPANQIITTVLDKKPRPIYYQDSKYVPWDSVADESLQLYRHAARIFKYQTVNPIVAGFNSGYVGQFDASKGYKLILDYGNENDTKQNSAAVKYMTEGAVGTFFGPLFYEDGMYLGVKDEYYMIIP